MINPILNINGSSASDLIEPRIKAINHLRDAIEALLQVTPNGRDYSDNDQCTADRNAHYDRIEAIHAIHTEIYKEAVAIKRQSDREA